MQAIRISKDVAAGLSTNFLDINNPI
jgi:hypothetical protein